MRSFILIAVILSLAGVHSAQAQNADRQTEALFTLVKPFDAEVSENGEEVRKPDLNQKIREGMEDLLLRLTGDGGLRRTEEGRQWVRDAKSWLKNYQFEPRKEEGVTVGQNLVLEFDRQRLLERFQTNQVLVWPSAQRPVTLVYGSFYEAGQQMKLTPETLSYRPDIEFRNYPSLLALPIRFPASGVPWFTPVRDEAQNSAMLAAMQRAGTQNLLAFRVIREESSRYALNWQVYNASAELVLEGARAGENLTRLMQSMFDEMMAAYSYDYRQTADVLGTASVSVEQLTSAQQLIEVERFLKQQKPTVHQVTLKALNGRGALFDVVYQGSYRTLLQSVSSIENSRLVSESAVTGQIVVKLQGLGERPDTQLIDLSKEYEMIQKEAR